MNFEQYIRVIEGFPTKEISFKDISPLLADPVAFKAATKEMAEVVKKWGPDAIIGPESRGFVMGAPVAVEAGLGFIMARKAGKLPGLCVSKTFTLEYGSATLQLPQFAIKPGMKFVIIDDLMATGGTLAALKAMIEDCGASVVGVITLIELTDLDGKRLISDVPYVSFVKYPH